MTRPKILTALFCSMFLAVFGFQLTPGGVRADMILLPNHDGTVGGDAAMPGELALEVNVDSQKVRLVGNGLTDLVSYQILSRGSSLKPSVGPFLMDIMLGSSAEFFAEAIIVGTVFNGTFDITPVYDFAADKKDLEFSYAVLSQLDPIVGEVSYVPEPASWMSMAIGILGAVVIRRRR